MLHIDLFRSRPGRKTAGDVVKEESIVRRLQRKYRRKGMALRKTRPVDVPSLGEWHVVDCGLNAVVRKNVDIRQEGARIIWQEETTRTRR
jgi:hypothetical protein